MPEKKRKTAGIRGVSPSGGEIMTVVMKEMTSWRVSEQVTGKVSWEADSGNRVMCDGDGKIGCWPSERKRKVGETGLWHMKNECYDGAEQR